jgi:tRNA threonylcarbamoyladenosine biosynthesis protein TsaE
MRIELRAETPRDTRDIGQAIAPLLRPRDALSLSGELGAGKTTLVQGIASGLGIREQVVSPTFTLVREYRGRLHLAHVDVYRLERIQDVVDLGLEEIGDGEAVLVVEWGDAIDVVLPADRLDVELTSADADAKSEVRRIVVVADGPSWRPRWSGLEGAVSAWSVDPCS